VQYSIFAADENKRASAQNFCCQEKAAYAKVSAQSIPPKQIRALSLEVRNLFRIAPGERP
jgi:hypothetical protein